ncbi:GGDEF domain-containing protein [Aquabacterium sp.]|uniref:GGDEF domain-containing protein n=1 Tax=Aquabacterium sp. TaxID=1872578 RepID=UPI0035B0874B
MADSIALASLVDDSMVGPLAHALDQLGIAVLVKDGVGGRYTMANQAGQHMLAEHGPLLVGRNDAEIFDATVAVAMRTADQQAVSLGSGFSLEHRLELEGHRRDFTVWRQAMAGEPEGRILSVWQDVTESRRREQQLQLALAQLEVQQKNNDELRRNMQDGQVRDSVSGLYHRVHFEEQLRREADLSSREQREFAVVSMSIDGLDEILRLHGAEGAERVIEALGRLLKANTRAMDSPCRLGGDRFVVLLSGIGLATAHSRMEQLRRQCAAHVVPYNGQQIPFTVSMGVASFPHTAGSVEEIMRSADRALGTARESGGNRVALASIQFVPAS